MIIITRIKVSVGCRAGTEYSVGASGSFHLVYVSLCVSMLFTVFFVS